MSEPRKFRPRALRAESVEAPLERRWEVMGTEEAKRLHARALAEHRRFAAWGPRTRARLLRHGVGTMVVFLVVGYLLIGLLHWVIPVAGLAVGLLVTFVRLPDLLYAPLYGAAGFAMIAVALGSEMASVYGVYRFAFGAFLFVALGAFVAKDEEFRRLDGED